MSWCLLVAELMLMLLVVDMLKFAVAVVVAAVADLGYRWGIVVNRRDVHFVARDFS
jgi:hypothetical protein